MTNVSRGWMELGAVLHNIAAANADGEEVEDDEEDLTSETRIMGFGSPEDREVAESAYKDKG